MLLSGVVFSVLFVFVFSVIVLTTATSADETALERRVEVAVVQDGRVPAKSHVPPHLKPKEKSYFGKLDTLLAERAISRRLQILIVQGGARTTVGTFAVMVMVLAVVTSSLVYLATGMLLFAAGTAGVACYAPLGWLQFKRARRVRAFNEALPDCIEMCARSLRVGNSIVAAIGIVAAEAVEPAKTEFAEVFQKQNYGLPLREALLQMLDRVPSMDLQVMVTGILVQKDTGGNLA